jgi:hypothetical protein
MQVNYSRSSNYIHINILAGFSVNKINYNACTLYNIYLFLKLFLAHFPFFKKYK